MENYSVKYDGKSVIYTEIPWHFKSAGNNDVDTVLNLTKSEKGYDGELTFLVEQYENTDKSISGKRIHINCGENSLFIVDLINSEEEICVYTDFTADNKDFTVSCNVAEKNKLVIRNSHCGIKHFRLMSEIDGTSIIDKTGLMMPYEVRNNGDVTYSMYEGLHSFGKKHITCFGICTATLVKIPAWHYKNDESGFIAEPPAGGKSWKIEVLGNSVLISDFSGFRKSFEL